uniref:ABC transporter substrate-binding protein n=1 Tax=Cyanothece sp. (strain PCC 7425 / ATCC 29141) TaxID=395961 RepID=B8HVW2_CYAP4
MKKFKRRNLLISLGITGVALALTFAPLPGLQQQITVVSGTELQEVLTTLKPRFEQAHPSIKVEFKFQGSQDIVNNFIDDKNDFVPTLLIPANGEILQELSDRWRTQNNSDPFYEPPLPIAKTLLVGIAWTERGKVLFPQDQFSWQRLEQALALGSWSKLGGGTDWGSFDLLMTDPTRSNSAQLALYLWFRAKLGGSSTALFDHPQIQTLANLIKRSVYQPPRSTDILLQEFIARGPNDADIALTYESIALNRWSQAQTTQGKPYQIYYIDPSTETTSTAALPRRNVDPRAAEAARTFLQFLTQPEQQAVFVQQGFRPVNSNVDLQTVANSPWQQKIPGAAVNPTGAITPLPDRPLITEIIRLWQRAA